MKKTLKGLISIALIAVMLLLLTGCGNKMVATKETEDTTMGKYKEELEFSFKKDTIDSIKMTYTFDNKESAESMAAVMNLGLSMSEEEFNMDIKQSGKKVTIKADAKSFAEISGADFESEEISKEKLKESLEKAGYKVK